jgi:hypothetical protein
MDPDVLRKHLHNLNSTEESIKQACKYCSLFPTCSEEIANSIFE